LRKKISIVFLLLIWLSISLLFKPNHLVTEEEIRRYGKTYLQTFRDEVAQFKLDDWVYFPSFVNFWNKTIDLKAMISESHGAAIEFVIDANTSHFNSVRTDDRIEVAVFGGVFSREHGLPFRIRQTRLIWVLEPGVNFITGGQCMFEVFDNATLAVIGSNWTLDGVSYFNPITVKGSNMYESWATNKAVWEAQFDFRYDLAYALNQSEGVREYVAYSELKEALSNIADRLKNDPSYGWSQLDSDLSEVSRIASEKYGVTRPDFVEEVFEVIRGKITLSKKLPVLSIKYDSNYIYTIFFSILLDVSYVFALFLNRVLKRLKEKSLIPLKTILEQFGEWFTFIFVFVSFFTNAPFGYEWEIHIPILVIQLIAFIFSSNYVIKFRFRFQLNWKNIFYRFAFGAVSLLLVLAIVSLSLPILFPMAFLLNSYSILMGEVTVLSVLTATITLIALLFSQLACNRFFEHFS